MTAAKPIAAHPAAATRLSDGRDHLAPWWELRFAVPQANAEDVSALLVDAGALGVQTLAAQEVAASAWNAHPSMGPSQDFAGPLAPGPAPAGGDGRADAKLPAATLPAGGVATLVTSFAGTLAASEVRHMVLEVLELFALAGALGDALPERQTDTAWAEAYKPYFKPMKVGRRLWLVPSWEGHFRPPLGSVTLTIDPGMAFGTGQHATTALCLRAIEDLYDNVDHGRPAGAGFVLPAAGHPPPARALDVGCGSGVLGLAALALGAQEATLVDIDAAALQASLDNLARAQLTARSEVRQDLPPPDTLPYDLVVANILAPTLLEMAPQLVQRLAAGGTLLLSGILADQAPAVVAGFAAAAKGLGRPAFARHMLQHGDWVAILLFAGPVAR